MQKLTENNEARPKFTGSYKKSVYNVIVQSKFGPKKSAWRVGRQLFGLDGLGISIVTANSLPGLLNTIC